MQRPMDLLNAKAGHNKTSHSYRYDGNHNVSDIFDFLDRSKDIKLTYDDVDRLDTASGSWGNGSFSYDSTGNLLTKHLGTQQGESSWVLFIRGDPSGKRLQRANKGAPLCCSSVPIIYIF